jgi:hypothetical protein
MFEHYLYISSMSDTLKGHLHDLASCVVERLGLGRDSFVIDVGSNDGTLLSGFSPYDIRTLGVDPAANLVEHARAVGVETLTAFFSTPTAKKILDKWGKASVVTATNTFPHIPNLADFLTGLDTVLIKGGTLVLEAHYLQDILDQRAFDTIYHEHVSYWALGPMVHLFSRVGFEVVDVERLPLHHGQIRVWVCRKGEGRVRHSVKMLLAEEESAGLRSLETYRGFAKYTRDLREKLDATLNRLLAEGKRVVGYGAPAKGNTLLTFLRIGPDRLPYIADRSPLKQGRFTPGTHIPIVPPERIIEDQPDYVLLLAWNFAEEIMNQQEEYRRRGGRFILPVPRVEVI